MTDNEIKKGLECCAERVDYEGNEDTCCSCSLITDNCCTCTLAKNALNLINRLQAENEELAYKLGCLLCHATGGKLSKHTYPLRVMESYVNDTIQEYCEEATEEVKAEAYKEFLPLLEKFRDEVVDKFIIMCDGNDYNKLNLMSMVDTIDCIYDKHIDNLLKEKVGDKE